MIQSDQTGIPALILFVGAEMGSFESEIESLDINDRTTEGQPTNNEAFTLRTGGRHSYGPGVS